MKINSLYTKIKLIFLVITVLLTALFGAYVMIDHGKNIPKMRQRYMSTAIFVTRYLRENPQNDENIESFLEANNFNIVADEKKIDHVLANGEHIHERGGRRIKFELIRLGSEHYLSIHTKQAKLLLEDTNAPAFPYYIIWWYILALLLLVLFYFWMTKHLRPLKELQQKIQRVGEGELSISLKSDQDDEIGEVANEFDKALRKIEALVNSRQLFLRTLMHELKTPIAKGRIVTEMVEEPLLQNQYETIFERLELLIEEFSKVEQMLSSRYHFNLNHYNIHDILDQALELLILDEESLEEHITIQSNGHFALKTDFNFLALALKNLIDNALKYSTDGKVTIQIDKDKISIINRGEPLRNGIESFFQPFHNQTDTLKGGLGLGLYIVKSITVKLDLSFQHHYTEGKHTFSIATYR